MFSSCLVSSATLSVLAGCQYLTYWSSQPAAGLSKYTQIKTHIMQSPERPVGDTDCVTDEWKQVLLESFHHVPVASCPSSSSGGLQQYALQSCVVTAPQAGIHLLLEVSKLAAKTSYRSLIKAFFVWKNNVDIVERDCLQPLSRLQQSVELLKLLSSIDIFISNTAMQEKYADGILRSTAVIDRNLSQLFYFVSLRRAFDSWIAVSRLVAGLRLFPIEVLTLLAADEQLVWKVFYGHLSEKAKRSISGVDLGHNGSIGSKFLGFFGKKESSRDGSAVTITQSSELGSNPVINWDHCLMSGEEFMTLLNDWQIYPAWLSYFELEELLQQFAAQSSMIDEQQAMHSPTMKKNNWKSVSKLIRKGTFASPGKMKSVKQDLTPLSFLAFNKLLWSMTLPRLGFEVESRHVKSVRQLIAARFAIGIRNCILKKTFE